MSDKGYNEVAAVWGERIHGLVEETLASADKPLSLSEIEDIALRLRARIGAEVTQALVAKQAPVAEAGAAVGGVWSGIAFKKARTGRGRGLKGEAGGGGDQWFAE